MTARRGLDGHVEMCACQTCRLMRRGRWLVLRSKDGMDVVRQEFKGTPTQELTFAKVKPCSIRHWRIVDDDGVVLHERPIDFRVDSEWSGYRIKIAVTSDVALSMNLDLGRDKIPPLTVPPVIVRPPPEPLAPFDLYADARPLPREFSQTRITCYMERWRSVGLNDEVAWSSEAGTVSKRLPADKRPAIGRVMHTDQYARTCVVLLYATC